MSCCSLYHSLPDPDFPVSFELLSQLGAQLVCLAAIFKGLDFILGIFCYKLRHVASRTSSLWSFTVVPYFIHGSEFPVGSSFCSKWCFFLSLWILLFLLLFHHCVSDHPLESLLASLPREENLNFFRGLMVVNSWHCEKQFCRLWVLVTQRVLLCPHFSCPAGKPGFGPWHHSSSKSTLSFFYQSSQNLWSGFARIGIWTNGPHWMSCVTAGISGLCGASHVPSAAVSSVSLLPAHRMQQVASDTVQIL